MKYVAVFMTAIAILGIAAGALKTTEYLQKTEQPVIQGFNPGYGINIISETYNTSSSNGTT